MSSAIKKWGQIDSRIKYFMAFGDVSGWTLDSTYPATTPVIGSTASPTPFTRTIRIPANSLMKDLGRAVTVYDDDLTVLPDYQYKIIYRQIQLVNGVATEGVAGTPANGYRSYWIKVWSSDGVDIAKVARTG